MNFLEECGVIITGVINEAPGLAGMPIGVARPEIPHMFEDLLRIEAPLGDPGLVDITHITLLAGGECSRQGIMVAGWDDCRENQG